MTDTLHYASSNVERIPCTVVNTALDVAQMVATRVIEVIKNCEQQGKKAVLCLPTGSTPLGVYRELCAAYDRGDVSFKNVITFNLDEYCGIGHDHEESYHTFMQQNLFSKIDIDPNNVHIPNGELPEDRVASFCVEYENKIRQAGGIDLCLLGIGRTGHIAFNEPGSHPSTRTRMVTLDHKTRVDAAKSFGGMRNVPLRAVTMGVGTILASHEILLLATGEHKAQVIARAVEEERTAALPASYIQEHKNACVVLDRPAAASLRRTLQPWVAEAVCWETNYAMARRAVVWLSKTTGKPITHLQESDFEQMHLQELVFAYGSAGSLCTRVFEDLMGRIKATWQLPEKTTCVVFSPHPDDDVICMGATIAKLVENENRVHVAWQTNGSVAVRDADVVRHLRFIREAAQTQFGETGEPMVQRADELLALVRAKGENEAEPEPLRDIKSHIRKTEAISAIEVLGVPAENGTLLDLPFYRTGMTKKKPVGEEDIEMTLQYIRQCNPDHIFIAGDLNDPHGTHRKCYDVVRAAFLRYEGELKAAGRAVPPCWLYRGSWVEWPVADTDVFVPMSEDELTRKIDSIFQHESQKDRAMFRGEDDREFWQRARDRNRGTAAELLGLGLPHFFAVESFVIPDVLPEA